MEDVSFQSPLVSPCMLLGTLSIVQTSFDPIPFPNINQTPKKNYPSQLEKISRYPKENEPEVFLNT